MIDYDKFRMSLKQLEVQHENSRTLEAPMPELILEAVAESVVKRFEICYDCLWKVLKRYLLEELGLADNSPKPIFRVAYENELFVAPLEQWLRYAEARTNTAHDYNNEKAQDCLEVMPEFIEDAIGLYQTMSGETWD